MKTIRTACAVFLALVLTGCPSKPIAPEERLALKRVTIASIELPEKPFMPPASTGAAFLIAGPLGVALANGSTDLPDAFKTHLAQNNIDVPAYIRSELRSQLKSKGIEVVDGGEAPVLQVQVLQYGLTGDITSADRFPQLWLKMTLKKRSGETIWAGWAAAHVTEGIMQQVKPRPIPEFFKDPVMLRRDLRKVTNIIVASATKDL